MRALVVEDQPEIRDLIKDTLESGGFFVQATRNGETGLELALGQSWHVIVLDIMLPGMDGWAVCQRLREARVRTPVLMLTARDAVEDRVKGLDIGADDYLCKPFNVAELLARVGALTRRDRVHKAKVIRIADLEVDTGAMKVRRAGKEVALTKREYTLLEALASREGHVLTRDNILERVWLDEESTSNTVEAYIKLLRKKIDQDYEPKLIQTVHGLGYRLQRPDDGAT